jgi:hypothetical protein
VTCIRNILGLNLAQRTDHHVKTWDCFVVLFSNKIEFTEKLVSNIWNREMKTITTYTTESFII